jgi:hypothetical protein
LLCSSSSSAIQHPLFQFLLFFCPARRDSRKVVLVVPRYCFFLPSSLLLNIVSFSRAICYFSLPLPINSSVFLFAFGLSAKLTPKALELLFSLDSSRMYTTKLDLSRKQTGFF